MHRLLIGIATLLALTFAAEAHDPGPPDWAKVLGEAKGQTVYFNAWGGDQAVNGYLEWVAGETKRRFGVDVVQVKLDDTAIAVAKVVAEKAAGKSQGGSVDLVWINGENFAAMKRQGLLLTSPWADQLPNSRFVDSEDKPTVRSDFTVPVDGLESPWGMAKLVFFYDSKRTAAESLPKSAKELLAWARKNPGRFAYPQPPDFTGTRS